MHTLSISRRVPCGWPSSGGIKGRISLRACHCDRLSHLELYWQPAVNHPWPFQGRKNRNNSDPQINPESGWWHWHPRFVICSPVELSWLVRVQPPLIPFPLGGEADVPWKKVERETGVRSLGGSVLEQWAREAWIISRGKENVLTCTLASSPYADPPSVLKNVPGSR